MIYIIKNKKFIKEKTFIDVQTLIVWFILVGLQLIVYVSRLYYFWFDNLDGIIVIFSSLVGILLFLVKGFRKIEFKIMLLYIFYLAILYIAIIKSNKFGTEFWLFKSVMVIAYFCLIGIYAMLVSQINLNENIFGLLCFISILILIPLLYVEFLRYGSNSFIRIGAVFNPMAVSNIAVVSIVYIMMDIIKRRKWILSIGVFMGGCLFVFILGTRRTFVDFIVSASLIYLSLLGKLLKLKNNDVFNSLRLGNGIRLLHSKLFKSMLISICFSIAMVFFLKKNIVTFFKYFITLCFFKMGYFYKWRSR